ncbi:MAG: hypothetical protein M0008_02515 [Actinomycetota bacterium]|nr:hypothetical protein [Actinomycetota bacterium]
MSEGDGAGGARSAGPAGLVGKSLEEGHDFAWAEVAQTEVAEPRDEVCLADPAVVRQGGGLEPAQRSGREPLLAQVLGQCHSTQAGVDSLSGLDVEERLGRGSLRLAPGPVRTEASLPTLAGSRVGADVDHRPPAFRRLIDMTGHGFEAYAAGS